MSTSDKETMRLLKSCVEVVDATVNMLKAEGKPVTMVTVIGNITLLSSKILSSMFEDDE